MRHTAYQRIIGAILCGVVLIVSGSEGVCQAPVCRPDGQCFPQVNLFPDNLSVAPEPRIPSPDSVRRVNNIVQSYPGNEGNAINGAIGQGVISKQDYVDWMNDGLSGPLKGRMQAYGNNLQNLVNGGEISQEKADAIAKALGKNSAAEVTAEDIEEFEKKAEEEEEEEEGEEEGHNNEEQEEDDTPPTTAPPNVNPNPDGGTGSGGSGGSGGGGISELAKQMLAQAVSGAVQKLFQGGGQQGGNGQQNDYGKEEEEELRRLTEENKAVIRAAQETKTVVDAENTANAIQATTTAGALTQEEEQASEAQSEDTAPAMPVASPTSDPIISGLT